jgi:hypothetical protein
MSLFSLSSNNMSPFQLAPAMAASPYAAQGSYGVTGANYGAQTNNPFGLINSAQMSTSLGAGLGANFTGYANILGNPYGVDPMMAGMMTQLNNAQAIAGQALGGNQVMGQGLGLNQQQGLQGQDTNKLMQVMTMMLQMIMQILQGQQQTPEEQAVAEQQQAPAAEEYAAAPEEPAAPANENNTAANENQQDATNQDGLWKEFAAKIEEFLKAFANKQDAQQTDTATDTTGQDETATTRSSVSSAAQADKADKAKKPKHENHGHTKPGKTHGTAA